MKRILCFALIAGSLFAQLGAETVFPVQEEEKETFTQKASDAIIKAKNVTLEFIKNHPYLTMAALVTIVNPKMREMAFRLPGAFWSGVKSNPIPTTLISGYFLHLFVQ